VPVNYVDALPSRVREIVDLAFGGITRGMHRMIKPTIAAVNGWALMLPKGRDRRFVTIRHG
jgi:hypothetical protein